MIAFVLILFAVGIIGAALGIFLIVKKYGSRILWISLLITAALCIVVSSCTLAGTLQERAQSKKEVYLAARYLEDLEPDLANAHLGRVEDTDVVQEELLAAQSLMEAMRGNSTISKLKLDLLRREAGQEDKLVSSLETLSFQDDQQAAECAELIVERLDLSKKQEYNWEVFYQAESSGRGVYTENGIGNLYEEYESLYGAEQAELLQIDELIYSQFWEEAIRMASNRVSENASAKNRLLLAEIVADSTYARAEISDQAFTSWEEGNYDSSSSAEKEKEEFEKKYEEISQELESVQLQLESAAEEERAELEHEMEQLFQEAEEYRKQADCVYAYRALNAIADIPTLEAKIVRARLYFAIQDYDAAMETLQTAADSPAVQFSGNEKMVSALKMVQQASQGESSVIGDSAAFSDALKSMLSSVFPELISITNTPLTNDFAARIISDQKYRSHDIYVTQVDDSAYPQIQVSISGQQEVIQDIVEKQNVIVKDTHHQVDYTVEVPETGDISICCVMDLSGSMSGQPLSDSKIALEDFIQSLRTGSQMAIVGFSDTAEILSEVTTDKVSLMSVVRDMGDGGGTNITAGIESGTEALLDAGGTRYMVVMTDGQSSIDTAMVQRAADEGIVIYTIGFGDVNDALLQEIADMTGGQYIRADSSTELSSVYNSLQGILGNQIILHYTVAENTEETPRYVFVRDTAYDTSVRRTYREGEEDTRSLVYYESIYPNVVTTEQMVNYQENGDVFTFNIGGGNLTEVTQVNIGDQTAVISEQEDTSLAVTMNPQLAPGLYDITLQLSDGSQLVCEQQLAVGNSIPSNRYRMGSLILNASNGVMLPDGNLALGSVSISDWVQEGSQREETLYLTTPNLILIPAPQVDLNEYNQTYGGVDLGDNGIFTGNGVVYVTNPDKAYSDDAPLIMTQGSFSVTCTPQESRLEKTEP